MLFHQRKETKILSRFLFSLGKTFIVRPVYKCAENSLCFSVLREAQPILDKSYSDMKC